MCVRQLERGRHEVENQYARSVRPAGNRPALKQIAEVFEVVPRKWRGIGEIAASGLGLREKYRRFDAALRFEVESYQRRGARRVHRRPGAARPQKTAQVRGLAHGRCTPEHPLGAPMVLVWGASRPIFAIAERGFIGVRKSNATAAARRSPCWVKGLPAMSKPLPA